LVICQIYNMVNVAKSLIRIFIGTNGSEIDLIKGEFGMVKNVFPLLNESYEEQVKCCPEILLKNEELYFFLPNFKTLPEIAKIVLEKYSKAKFEKCNHMTLSNKIFSKVLDSIVEKYDYMKNVKFKTNKEDFLFESQIEIISVLPNEPYLVYLASMDYNYRVYITRDEIIVINKENEKSINFSDVLLYENSELKLNTNIEFVKKISSPKVKKILLELCLLASNANVDIDLHPFRHMDEAFKKKYMECLVSFALFEKELTASQLIRLEEISRQFNIQSNWLKEKLINDYLMAEKDTRKEKIKELAAELDFKDRKNLAVDTLSLDILRRKISNKRDKLVGEIDTILEIKYSEVVQINEHLEQIFK